MARPTCKTCGYHVNGTCFLTWDTKMDNDLCTFKKTEDTSTIVRTDPDAGKKRTKSKKEKKEKTCTTGDKSTKSSTKNSPKKRSNQKGDQPKRLGGTYSQMTLMI